MKTTHDVLIYDFDSVFNQMVRMVPEAGRQIYDGLYRSGDRYPIEGSEAFPLTYETGEIVNLDNIFAIDIYDDAGTLIVTGDDINRFHVSNVCSYYQLPEIILRDLLNITLFSFNTEKEFAIDDKIQNEAIPLIDFMDILHLDNEEIIGMHLPLVSRDLVSRINTLLDSALSETVLKDIKPSNSLYDIESIGKYTIIRDKGSVFELRYKALLDERGILW